MHAEEETEEAEPPMIYVDDLFGWPAESYRDTETKRVGARSGHRWCHLFADVPDSAELHAFAASIGLRRSWFQKNHYDLTPSRRALAVARGAKEVGRTEAVMIRRAWRAKEQST